MFFKYYIIIAGLTAALLLGVLALLAFAPRASTTSGGEITSRLHFVILIIICAGYGQSSYGYQRTSQDYDYYYDDSYRRRSGSEAVDGE